MNYQNIVEQVEKKFAQIQLAEEKLKDYEIQKTNALQQSKTLADCQELAQVVAQGIQQQAHSMIARVVSKCLSAIFDEPYVFQILFERKRNKTEARLVFERDGMEIDPITSSGGGVLDVAAFALRLAAVVLTKPRCRKIIIMDEPFRFVSQEYRFKIRQLLLDLAKEYDFQFIMVTHIRELVCGTNVDLS